MHSPDSVPPLPVPEPLAALSAVPAWRREPYRVLFPMGLLLTWARVHASRQPPSSLVWIPLSFLPGIAGAALWRVPRVPGLLSRRPWQVPVYGGLLLLAAVFRALVDFDGRRFFPWLAASSGVFLLASACWAVLVFPCLWRQGGEA